MFWNLLTNAIKFTGSDGTITVALRSVGDTVEFEIVDTGIGIRREVLPFVFDRFRQADSSTTRTYGGLGLGLAIVRHIIELHGGMVRAASAGEGHGATFTIQLAAAGHGASEPQLRRRSPDPAVRSLLGGRRILVVDDHDDAREMIAGVLEEAGARVLFAASTAEAIDRARRERPDLLVTDIGLPDQDGYALLAELRALYPQLAAVALTAYARSTDRERAAAAGFQQHVIKPVDPNRAGAADRVGVGERRRYQSDLNPRIVTDWEPALSRGEALGRYRHASDRHVRTRRHPDRPARSATRWPVVVIATGVSGGGFDFAASVRGGRPLARRARWHGSGVCRLRTSLPR